MANHLAKSDCTDEGKTALGGICKSVFFQVNTSSKRLASGLDTSIEGPRSPPFNNPSRLSARRPPFSFFALVL